MSGRERGAGIRVVRGETTGYAHTADLTEAGLREAAEAAAAAAARASPGATHVVALDAPRRRRRRTRSRSCPETVEKARKAEVLERADDAARAESDSIRQVSASYADAPPPDPRRQLRRPARRGRPGAHPLRRELRGGRRHRACRPGMEAPGRTVGFELFDEIDPEEVARIAAARARSTMLARPARAERASCRSC